MSVSVEEFAEFLQLKPMEKQGYKFFGSNDMQVGIFSVDEMKKYMTLIKTCKKIDMTYIKLDITSVTNQTLYVCYDQKKKKKDWLIYASIFFRQVEKHFGQPFFYLAVNSEAPAYCYMNKEYALIVAGMVYDPCDAGSLQYSKVGDIFDFMKDIPESVQDGLSDFV